MDAVTYPQSEVIDFLNNEMIPLQQDPNGARADLFFLRWTPTSMILDDGGKEHHRLVGFLPPDEFIPALILANGKVHFGHARFKQAESWLNRVVSTHGSSFAAPEAIYLRAISRYRLDKDTSNLKQAYSLINEKHPQSEWAQRVLPYRLLS